MYHARPKEQFIIYTYHFNYKKDSDYAKGEEGDREIFHGIGLRRLICFSYQTFAIWSLIYQEGIGVQLSL